MGKLVKRLRDNDGGYEHQDPIWETRQEAADRIEELEADVATALEALQFYADPDHWEPPYANPGENPFSVLDEDEGEVARVAIAQITGIPR